MRSWKDDEGPYNMPFKGGNTFNISRESTQRLVALIGPQFGTSKHEVLKSLLTLGERAARKKRRRRAKAVKVANGD